MKRIISLFMSTVLLVAFFSLISFTTQAQGTLENTIWKRDVPSENATLYYHFIGKSRLLEIISRKSSYSTVPNNTIAEGIYQKTGNEVKLIFKGGQATSTLNGNQLMIGSNSHDLFKKQTLINPIPVVKEKCFSLPDPFSDGTVTVTTDIDSKYLGTYLFDGVWDTKIILSKNTGDSRYWIQVFPEGTYRPEEKDYYFDDNKKNDLIKWGVIVEDNSLLKTNPIVNANLNQHQNEPVDNCLIMVFQYPDESVSYLFVVEINGAISLIYNTMEYKKVL